MTECEHDFRHMEEIRFREDHGSDFYNGVYVWRWVLEQRFYCKKCLKVRSKKKEEISPVMPEWYKR